KEFRKLLGAHWGKVLGGFLGLLIGLTILLFGFWRSLLLFFCIAAGIYLGRFFDRHEVLQSLLQRFWPDRD
ncbi:MAG: DUF2273 domain-containing protein, partial [Firmicutes bacterium]|nr:DUF2273 domain-containing protein [Bacillota bacterium]